jgi:flagellar basal body-associated protein FliL
MDEQTNIHEEPQPKKQSTLMLIIIGVVVALIAIAAAVLTYHHVYTKPLLQENEDLKELAELESRKWKPNTATLTCSTRCSRASSATTASSPR